MNQNDKNDSSTTDKEPQESDRAAAEEAPEEPKPQLVPAEILERIKKRGIDPDDPDAKRILSVVIAELFVGPIPPADILRGYEDLRPGSADQIIGWTERQITHRLERETVRSDRSEDRMDRGQRHGFRVALFGLALAGALAYFGNSVATMVVAIVIALVAVGGPAAATVLSRYLGGRRGDPD